MTQKTKSTLLYDKKPSSWINKQGQANLDDVKRYTYVFVTICEAYNTSRQTKGFIDDMRLNNTKKVSTYYTRLINEGIHCRTAQSAAELGQYLMQSGIAEEEFDSSEREFVFYVYGSTKQLCERMSLLPEYKKKDKTSKTNKRDYYRFDSLLRHLRNAFAHGMFACRNPTGTCAWWMLEDIRKNGVITARFYLKQATLDMWCDSIINKKRKEKCK